MQEICYRPVMHAGSPRTRQRARTPYKVIINEEGVAKVAARYGLKRKKDVADFLGIDETTWWRLRKSYIKPGNEIIGAVLGPHSEDPEINFDALFKVVPA